MFNLRLFSLLLLIMGAASSQSSKEAQLIKESIDASAEQLRQIVTEAVSQRGGNLENQHVHLVLAFSTGHYPRDPLGAEAARELAWQLIKKLSTPGDQLSVFAWELNVYDTPTPQPLTITQTILEQEKPVRDLFPKTARVDSIGGHDTERTLVELGQYMGGGGQDVVFVLLTNSAASVAPRGVSLLGSNELSYRSFLERYDRLEATTATGASLQLQYEIRQPNGDILSRSIDIVIAVPKQFIGRPIEGRTRHQAVPSSSGTEPAGTNILPFVLGVLFVMGLLAYAFRSGRAPAVQTLQIAGESFELPGGSWSIGIANIPVGEEIIHIAGGGYPERVEKTRVLPKSLHTVPPVQIARIERSRKGVRFTALPPNRLTVDGVDYPESYELVAGRDYRVRVAGEAVTNPVLGPQPFEVEMRVSVGS